MDRKARLRKDSTQLYVRDRTSSNTSKILYDVAREKSDKIVNDSHSHKDTPPFSPHMSGTPPRYATMLSKSVLSSHLPRRST
jgi:hypothetical protein